MMLMSSDGLSLSLEGEAVRLESFEISGYEIKPQLGRASGSLGPVLHSITLGQREIKIEGYISAELEKNRRTLAKICTQDKPFFIVDGDYRLEAVASYGPELSCQRRFLNKLLKFTLIAKTIAPLWQSKSDKTYIFGNRGGVSSPEESLRVINEGDSAVGFVLEVQMRTSADGIMIAKDGENIDIQRAFSFGDTVIIDTRRGKKGIMLVSAETGETTDIIDTASLGSTFFELEVGENVFSYAVRNGISTMTFRYTPCYLR